MGQLMMATQEIRNATTPEMVRELWLLAVDRARQGDNDLLKYVLSRVYPERLVVNLIAQMEHEHRHQHVHVHYALPKGVEPIAEPPDLRALAEFAEVIE